MVSSRLSPTQTPLRRTHRAFGTGLGAAAVAMLLVAPIAQAAPPRATTARKTVVVDLSVDERAHAEIAREVARAVARHTNSAGERDYIVRDIHGPLNAGGEVRQREAVATAAGFVDAGKAALAAKDYEDAVDQLRSARRQYEESLAILDETATYAETLTLLGESMLGTGNVRGATEAFQRAAMLRSDGAGLSDKGAAAFAKAKATVEDLPFGAVQVNTDPPFAAVYVDGRFKGISPTTAAGLREGSHVIAVQKTGFERSTTVATVSSEKMASTDITLKTARRKLLYDGMTGKIARELDAAGGDTPMGGEGVEELGTLFRTEAALVIESRGDADDKKGITLSLLHVPTQRVVNTVELADVDWSSRNRDAIEAGIKKLVAVDWIERLGGTSEETTDEDEGGILTKWWFWTAVVVVAGGTAAAIILTQEDDAPPPFEKNGTGAVVLGF